MKAPPEAERSAGEEAPDQGARVPRTRPGVPGEEGGRERGAGAAAAGGAPLLCLGPRPGKAAGIRASQSARRAPGSLACPALAPTCRQGAVSGPSGTPQSLR